MGFNSAFKGLMSQVIKTAACPSLQYFFNPSIGKSPAN
jgi:hypothetical protein